jgi:hypothetical protein
MQPPQYLPEAIRQLQKLKQQAERAMVQIPDADWFTILDPEANSIAIILKHIAGNMHSRWTDFLTTDGEKPDRNRDAEFILEAGDTKEQLLSRWEAGWQCLFEALAPLTPEDLDRTVLIREEPHSVLEAINRQVTHYAYHVGQIVLLAKHYAGENWQTLSVPRRKATEFHAARRQKRAGA